MEEVSGPGNRICVVVRETTEKDTMLFYTMDMSPFKVEKKKHCSSCYRVKLSGKKKEEGLVVGEALLERRHDHQSGNGNENRIALPVVGTDCEFSSFAAVDKSTLYCVSFCLFDPQHSHGSETLVQRFRLDEGEGEGGGGGGDFITEKCASPRRDRITPQLLGLDGKLYVFGGLPHYTHNITLQDWEEEEDYPWSEVFDPVTGQWDVFAVSPPAPSLVRELRYKFYAASYNSRVFIISPHEQSLFVHKPDGSWERLACSPMIKCIEYAPAVNSSRPLLVGSAIYWLSHNSICAYDFKKDVYFRGDVPNYDIAVGNRSDENFRLLHIGDDAEESLFCIVWLEPGLATRLLHFMRVRVSKDYDSKRILISIISCSSKATQNITCVADVVLMDRFADGMKKQNVEMEFREMPNKDPSSSKDFGANFHKRCKKGSVDLENVLSQIEESSDGKVVRSKKIRNLPIKLLPSKEDSESKAIKFPYELKRCSSRKVESEKSVPSK